MAYKLTSETFTRRHVRSNGEVRNRALHLPEVHSRWARNSLWNKCMMITAPHKRRRSTIESPLLIPGANLQPFCGFHAPSEILILLGSNTSTKTSESATSTFKSLRPWQETMIYLVVRGLS
ncbi:hypothetical protein CEXT_219331 [Caerostris extrusa]|uniref:Uncharacterized protein n=1 Tax=Caerostris extrusa TaxID=172846 RepID=A0AAV4UHE5_CAEEX|nr:hypothetical protein CEXT_219331 [Caerostris extrusa]